MRAGARDGETDRPRAARAARMGVGNRSWYRRRGFAACPLSRRGVQQASRDEDDGFGESCISMYERCRVVRIYDHVEKRGRRRIFHGGDLMPVRSCADEVLLDVGQGPEATAALSDVSQGDGAVVLVVGFGTGERLGGEFVILGIPRLVVKAEQVEEMQGAIAIGFDQRSQLIGIGVDPAEAMLGGGLPLKLDPRLVWAHGGTCCSGR